MSKKPATSKTPAASKKPPAQKSGAPKSGAKAVGAKAGVKGDDALLGKPAPDFTMATDGGGIVTLSKLKGQPVVLYFYPKDNTTGCTAEACGFRDNLAKFNKAKAVVIGISKDSPKSHDNFKAKQRLNFTLASDADGKVCERYGVWIEKTLYGRKYMGIDRATFIVDAKGKIARAWRKVKVPGHVDEVLEAVRTLA